MENQMVQSLHSLRHHQDKLELVQEIYDYLELNETKRNNFFNMGGLVYGLIVWAETSYFQVSSLSLKILSLIVRAMKMNFMVYSQCTYNVAKLKLGDSKPTVRNAARTLLADIFTHSTAYPKTLHHETIDYCLSRKNHRVIEQGLIFITESLLSSQEICFQKYFNVVCELTKHQNKSIKSAAMDASQLLRGQLGVANTMPTLSSQMKKDDMANCTGSESGIQSGSTSLNVERSLTSSSKPDSTCDTKCCPTCGQTINRTNLSSLSSISVPNFYICDDYPTV